MGTSYPSGLDNFTNPTASDTLDSVTVPHATQHANLNDAVEAIETELGVNPSGASADVATRLDGIDSTLSGKVSFPLSNAAATTTTAQYTTKVTGDTNDRFNVDAAGKLSWGSGAATADVTLSRTASNVLTLTAGVTITPPTGATSFPLEFGNVAPASGGSDVTLINAGSGVAPSITTLTGTVYGLRFAPTLSQGSLTSAYPTVYAIQAAPTASYNVTTAYGLQAKMTAVAATISTFVGVDVASVQSFGGAITTGIGLRITSLTAGTAWAMQIGDYQSYHQGRLTLGGTTAPTYALDIKGTAQDRGVIALAESTATPTNPSASAQALLYMKADKLVIGYLDGATMRYKYLDLTGVGVTWVHTTTAP